MANEMIYDFKKLFQEPETNQDTQQIRALKQNFKALNKNVSNLGNSKCEGGFTFLQCAVWANATGLVKTFLQHEGIDVNAQSDAGLTALQLAIIQNSPKILKMLLSHPEIDLNLACLDGWTALHLAVSYGYEKLIAEILKFKSKLQIDARMRHQITPLQLAALLDKRNLLKILLANGADAQLTTATGETALKLAEQFKFQNAVEILRIHAAAKIFPEIDFSADGVNDAATLQLLRATFEGKVDEIKSLLDQGNIDLEAVRKSGKNIWDFAILNGDPAVVECLLEATNQKADLTDLLFKAAKMGSLTIVKYLMEVKNLKPQLKNEQNQPLLIAATLGASLELVRYLIEVQNVDINEKCEKKVVFDYAAIGGNLDIMLYLAKISNFKFDANIGGTNFSILFAFVRVGYLENVKYLIEVEKLEFKDKKAPENGTILHEAARNKNLDVVKYFVEEHGLNFMERDDKGYVPLFYAVESNNLAVVKYFVEEQNLSIYFKDKENRTALHIASLNGHLEIVRYLVEERKANINAEDLEDLTPLMLSAQNGVRIETFNYLWKLSKANLDLGQLFYCFCAVIEGKNAQQINLAIEEIKAKLKNQKFLLNWQKNNLTGNKPSILLAAARDGNLTLIKFLIEDLGMDANMKGEKNRTALHIAAMNGHLEIVRYLVEGKKANVNAKDNDTKTLLLLSFKSDENATANSGHVKVMKYLWNTVTGSLNLDKLADYIRIEKYGKNSYYRKEEILIDAAYKGHLTVIKFLIEDVGMDANVKGEVGQTPIFRSVESNQLQAVKYFVECAKVDLHARNIYNQTIRGYARSYGRIAIDSYLASKGAPLY